MNDLRLVGGRGIALADRRRPPSVQDILPGAPGDVSAYFGVSVDAAVNLLEARAYTGLDRPTRLRAALIEQQQFLGGLLAHQGRAAFDLRTEVRPDDEVPLRVSLLGRTWASDRGRAAESAEATRSQLLGSLPRHVIGRPIDSAEELADRLDPHRGRSVRSATLVRRELIAQPSRRDAGVPYYFSISPQHWVDQDWSPVYRALVESGSPLTLSVALFPVGLPMWFTQSLAQLATWYGRLALDDQVKGGLYYGARKIPPDAFAVEAARVFADYLQRWSARAFVMRVQVSGPHVPPGLVELISSATAPADADTGPPMSGARLSGGADIRWSHDPSTEQQAAWNLSAIDCLPVPGRDEIWNRADPPPRHFALLSVLGDATDAAGAFRLPVAVDGTVPGFRVRRGDFGHAEVYAAVGPSVQIGRLAGGGQSLRLPIAALTKHTLVAGSPGSGKTTTVLELLAQLWVDHRKPFLVIEPVNAEGNDYRRLLSTPGCEQVELITVGDERGRPLRFNPFQVPPGVLVGEHASNLLSCFKAAFGLWEPLPSIYQEALDEMYLAAGILSSEVASDDPRRWPTAVEFLRAMVSVTSKLTYAGEIKANIEAASVRRAQQLVFGTGASSYFTDQPLDIAGLLDRPVIMELKTLGSQDDQSLMMALLLNAMTEYYKSNRSGTTELKHVTVIEEAHRLLARPRGAGDQAQAQAKEQAASDFANVLAENRKYGEGVIIAEQIPTKLVEDAVKNTNLKIMHRLTAEEDRQYLGRSMGLDDPQERFATRLGTGEALVYSDEYAEASHVAVVRTVTESPSVVGGTASPPFEGCAPCRAKCLYRGASMALLRDGDLRTRLRQLRTGVSGDQPDKAELRLNWQRLLTALRDRVRSVPSMPSDEPAVSDAAYCLFLHDLGADSMVRSQAWPRAVAQRLGVTVKETRV